MKRLLSLLLSFGLLLQPFYGLAAGADGLSILDEEDYAPLAAPQSSSAEPEDEPGDEELMQYSQKFWAQAAHNIDGVQNIAQMELPMPITQLRPSFALPLMGTSISLTGRKTFGIKLDSKKYKNDDNATFKKSYSNTEFEQEMQIKMEGKIAERIFVNIDYDDQEEDDKQIISVSYKGREGELVQSADFGDIELALPKTEFISFNKQLFGAKMHLQHKNANLRLIGSRTKGSGKVKQFKGASVFETISVPDKSYARHTYYDIKEMAPAYRSFLSAPIQTNTEQIYVYDNSAALAQQNSLYQEKYSDLASTNDETQTAKFRLLMRGVDYNLDYSRNVITFRSPLADSAVVAIDFTSASGQRLRDIGPRPGTIKLIKTENDRPRPEDLSSDGLHNNPLVAPEIKTVYNIGRQQIERDNGIGNFSLRLLDANGNFIGQNEGLVYPTDITVDFDKGTFQLRKKINDTGLYLSTPVSYRNLSFQVEIYSKVKSYYVEPGIVVQSETVTLDGRKLDRTSDYYIDYASGFITFYRPNMISESSTIDVTYDTEDGGENNTTLLGARFDYDITPNIGFGGTIIQEGGEKPQSAPTVGNETESITVYEGDFKAKDIKITDRLKVSASGEIAKSVKNKNLYGSAFIDNMDDIKQTAGASTNFLDWQYAANPTSGENMYYGSINWDTLNMRSLDINPHATASTADTQNVLVIDYDFSKSEEVSIVYPLSESGTDLSEFNNFELTALGETGGPLLNVHYGQIDEISDTGLGDNTIQCSQYYPDYVPKTEDIYCRGNISSSEDIGWKFEDPDGTVHNYNPFVSDKFNRYNRESQPNGRIDTQDLDGNGRLDAQDTYSGGSFGYNNDGSSGPGLIYKPDGTAWNYTLNNTSWTTYLGTLAIDNDTVRQRWTAVKQVRLSLKKAPGGKDRGTVYIAAASLSGNAWIAQQNKEYVLAKNTADNTDYKPIYNDTLGDGRAVFQKLYGSLEELKNESRNQNVFEQTLAFTANPGYANEITAQRNYSSMDFSSHEEFSFLLQAVREPDPDSYFFVRLGTEQNYKQINVNFTAAGLVPGRWKQIILKMEDTSGDHVPDALVPITPGVTVEDHYSAGAAEVNFKKISMLVAGLDKGNSAEIWFNEVFLDNAQKAEGTAYRADARVDYEGWGAVGGTYKHVDDLFETPVAVATGQETTNQNYFVEFTKIKNLPVYAGYSKDNVYTPTGLSNDNTNTISHLDYGEVDRSSGYVRTEFNKEGLPKVGLEYNFNQGSYEALTREDDVKTYSVNISHTRPEKIIKEVSLGYSLSNAEVSYSAEKINDPQDMLFNTTETTNRYSFNMNLEPWKGATFVPTYSLSDVKEEKFGNGVDASYKKAMSQNAGFTSNIKITDWLIPMVSYNVYTNENANLAEAYVTGRPEAFGIGQIKTINRTADGGVSLTLNAKEIFSKNRLLGGLTLANAYKLQDADSWADIESGYDSKTDLWVRSALKPTSEYAARRYMTLRDSLTSTQKWYPFKEYKFKGAAGMLDSFSIFNTFVKTYQDSEETGTLSSSVSTTLPDVVVNIGDFEKLWGNTYWLSATNVKFRYTLIENEVLTMEDRLEEMQRLDVRFLFMNRFDTLLYYAKKKADRRDLKLDAPLENTYENEYSAQTAFNYKQLRITPKILYAERERIFKAGTLNESTTNINPSLNFRLDVALPGGLWIPFVKRNYATSNRIIWNTTFSYQRLRSPVMVLENRDVYDATTSLDYEFSQNLRFTLSGGVTMYESLFVESESYLGYNVSGLMTLQF